MESLTTLGHHLLVVGSFFGVAVAFGAAALAVGLGGLIVATGVAVGTYQLRVLLFGKPPQQPGSRAASGRLRGLMKRMARETILLVPAKEPGFSKLGGDPELPAAFAWPQGREAPRTFVAQIDLGSFRQHTGPGWLPEQGRLYAFWDEAGAGAPDHVIMVYTTDPPGPPQHPPAGAKWRFPERRVAFMVMTSLPSTDWLDMDLGELDGSDVDELAGAHDLAFGDEIQHRIGGYPSEIQGGQMQVQCELLRRGVAEWWKTDVSPAVRRASKQWRLLLQIDSDRTLKMNWDDGGRLYVFIREKDARAGDFSQTVSLSQTY